MGKIRAADIEGWKATRCRSSIASLDSDHSETTTVALVKGNIRIVIQEREGSFRTWVGFDRSWNGSESGLNEWMKGYFAEGDETLAEECFTWERINDAIDSE